MQKHTTMTYGDKIARAAGSLTALALLPAGAQAGIVFHNTAIGPVTGTFGGFWDVDGSGQPEFDVRGSLSKAVMDSQGSGGRGLIQKNSQAGVQFQNLPLNFAVGPSVAAGYRFGAAGGYYRFVATNNGPYAAKGFSSGVPGYFGFQFTDAGGSNLYYGWAQITVVAQAYTINEWAYESCAGQGIAVGATSGGASCGGGGGGPVPEPSMLSLALIGMGAGGVRAWRKRKQALALAA